MNKKFRLLRSQEGFTLMELIVAVGIMLILAAVATPMLMAHIKDAKVSSVNEQLMNVKSAFNSYFTKSQGLISDSNGDNDFLDEMLSAGWLSADPSRHGLTWTINSYTDGNNHTAYYIHITNNPTAADGGDDAAGYSYITAINSDVDATIDGSDDGSAGTYQYTTKDLTDSDSVNDTLNACYLLYEDGGMTQWHSTGAAGDCG